MHNKTEMAIGFGFKWNRSLSLLTSHHFQNWLALFAFRQFRAKKGLIGHQRTQINFKTPFMKIEKVVLRNEWRGIRSLSLRQFVSTITPRPLWLTWAIMSTYRESPDFQLFQNWNHFNYSQCIRELKDDRKMDDLARLIMSQTLGMIPYPVTLYWHWIDQS